MSIIIHGKDMPPKGEFSRLRIYDNGDVTVGDGDNEAVVYHAEQAEDLLDKLEACRIELCVHCGRYKKKNMGLCDGCRWEERK